MNVKTDNLIVGGGIIGLSIAYELAKRGQHVTILEQNKFGRKASWAGAGILVPANASTAIHPQEQLEAISHDLHEQWAAELLERTGINNGFRKCGGLYIARTAGEVAALTGLQLEWSERQIEYEILDVDELDHRSPLLNSGFVASQSSGQFGKIRSAIWMPGESQFSNPHHLQALVVACRQMGVVMLERTDTEVVWADDRIQSVLGCGVSHQADHYFLTAGPWTEKLVAPSQVPLPMQPVRGQIALYKLPEVVDSTTCWPILNEGSRYLVPRMDGHVLAGATIEEVGFECVTTEDEVSNLRAWAESLNSSLNEATYVKSWAGIRPGTYDGFAYMGRLSGIQNGFVATGHFKGGLHLSTGTAVVMADLAMGETPSIDLLAYSPSRAAEHPSMESK